MVFGKDKRAFEHKNFKYLDDLIHSGAKEIILDSNIVLGDGEESEYLEGIRLDIDDVTIDGNGFAVDAKGKTRIFQCTGKNITIENIILKNGFSKGKGGAILNEEGWLTITESILADNAAQHNGGAIYNKGELIITETTLQKNTTRDIFSRGGAIDNRGELTIAGSTLNNNKAQGVGSWSGAINNMGELTITGSTLNNNAAPDYGGAIKNMGELTITGSTLNNNAAQESGGAIHNKGEITITESTLADNSTEGSGGAIYTMGPLNIKKSSFAGNGAKRDGGAISNHKGALKIEESSFTANAAQKNGGVIYYKWGEINITDSILSKNVAKGKGGAIWLLYSTKFRSDNCTFKDNSSNDVYVKYESVKNYRYLDDVIHSGEHEIVLDCDIILDDDEKSQYEHGIRLDVDNLVIDGAGHFINAKAASIFVVRGENIVLKNFIFKGAFSSYGSAIDNEGKLHIQDCAFKSNLAISMGGAIRNSGDLTISGSLFDKNSVYDPKYAGGGAIVNDSKLRISDSSFTDNMCDYNSGAIYNSGELSVKGCRFESNYSGAILNNKMMCIENSRFSNHSGSAIMNSGMTLISDSSFKDNRSKYGGGAIDNSGQLVIRGCHFKSNKSDSCGGAIGVEMSCDEHELTIMDSSFGSNEAYSGGAICHENIWIRNSVFRNNFSETGGSAIDSNYGVNICGCDFESNITEEDGGTIMAYMYESEIKDCTFKDNSPSDVCDN